MKTIRSWLRRPAGWMMVIMLMGAGAAWIQIDRESGAEGSSPDREAMVEDVREFAAN